MAIEKINIERFLELAKEHPVLDVRSPGEFKHAHIPGAVNLPLFTDEERKIVGTTYKQKSREEAIKIGLDLFGPKMKKMVEEVESAVRSSEFGVRDRDSQQKTIDYRLSTNNSRLQPPDSRLLIYCWRGGMRSAGVAWLMDLYGFKVYTLVGGYKKFRNYVLDTFRLPFRFKILGGYTGSGKTETLKVLKERSEKVIDLENIAGHKGSAFGNIGLPAQPSQEMFENVLATKLRSQLAVSSQQSANLSMAEDCELQTADCIWLEDESQRIGQVNIPNDLWKTMRRSPVYFLDINFEERLKHLTEEYGGLDKEQVLDAIGRIKEKLGGLNAKMASQLLIEGNIIESFRILLEYYDRAYSKSLHNREGLNSLLHTIESKSITPENANLLVPHPIPEAGIYRMEKL